MRQLASDVLDAMLAIKYDEPPTDPERRSKPAASPRAAYAGTYLSESYWAKIDLVDDRVTINVSGQPGTLSFVGQDEFRANGRYYSDVPVVFRPNEGGEVSSFTALDQTFMRIDPADIAPGPEAWRGLTGSYGPPYIPLIVTQKYGCLFAMTENMMDYRLTPQNRVVFNMPPGLYTDEELVFQIDEEGRSRSVILANMQLQRIE